MFGSDAASSCDQSGCHGCKRGFTIFRSRVFCRRCGGNFCESCCEQTTTDAASCTRIKVCTPCHRFIQENCGHPIYQMLGYLAPTYFDAVIATGCVGPEDVRRMTTNEMLSLLKSIDVADERHRMYLIARLSQHGAGQADKASADEVRSDDSLESLCESAGLTSSVAPSSRRRTLSMRSFSITSEKPAVMNALRDERRRSMFCTAFDAQSKERCFRTSLTVCLEKLSRERFLRRYWQKLHSFRISSRIVRGFLLNSSFLRADVKRRRTQFLQGRHHCDSCAMCGGVYTFFRREHHCRICYQSCCSSCAPRTSDVRQCHACCDSPDIPLATSPHSRPYSSGPGSICSY
eukprot:TRINITY_DN14445_c0_g1_i1.p1 TRINITY_DN14445_c0_g1~~TRINITY_DN14445_c0_g1_i1.p1  ORF type:complete len:347 (+),score=103.07 TRINITY_DN14445_c0_g1_i1:1861-2901(+)